MKKFITTVFIVLLTIGVFAQKGERKHKKPNLTAEQIADLKTKKMVLSLDLSEKQEKQIYEINKQNAIERQQKMKERKAMKESGKELSSDQLYQLKSERLEKAIAKKAEMKTILNTEQYEKWEKMAKRKGHKMKRNRKGKRGKRMQKQRK